ncbi:RNA methyltransferase [Desulfuromonas thiophila]|uniref:tRNA/rRNA methyltransferase n=1 Tax=Desulfuromonas thiophila TaxID=57664 RepID=A0A1G6XEL7_9BACT|nr:RNA methyltransferase [Desulfuromonas thiophila]SDD76649.1 tRNA/rRNA methyltransferase [Desulfuromonas thiophila]
MTALDPTRLVLVLVEPQQPGNIGAACRAMANFGVQQLRLVNPCNHLAPEAVKFAVSASPLLGQAERFSDLPAALADLHFSVALTRRLGRLRGQPEELPRLPGKLARLPSASRIALVFGREDMGLTTAELMACSSAATIATPGDKGSLNLAQAVVVTLYELTRSGPAVVDTPAAALALPNHQQIESLMRPVEELIDRIGYSNPSRPEVIPAALRRLLARALPDPAEINLLRGLVEQLSQSVQDWPGKRRG